MPAFDMSTFTSFVIAALADPFRIALMAALVYTQSRTARQTGTVLPLVAGVAFVALMIPMTMGFDAAFGLPLVIGAGIVANILLVVPIFFAMRLWLNRGR